MGDEPAVWPQGGQRKKEKNDQPKSTERPEQLKIVIGGSERRARISMIEQQHAKQVAGTMDP